METTQENESDIILRPRKRLFYLVLIVSALITLLGLRLIFITDITDDNIAGLTMVCIAALFIVLFGVDHLPKASYIRITNEGFQMSNLYKKQTVSWSDIVKIYSGRYLHHDAIFYELKNTKHYKFFSLISYNHTAKELVDKLNNRRQSVLSAK